MVVLSIPSRVFTRSAERRESRKRINQIRSAALYCRILPIGGREGRYPGDGIYVAVMSTSKLM